MKLKFLRGNVRALMYECLILCNFTFSGIEFASAEKEVLFIKWMNWQKKARNLNTKEPNVENWEKPESNNLISYNCNQFVFCECFFS